MTGTIDIGPSRLRFEPSDGSPAMELPLAKLKLTAGGASDRLFFFSHPDAPDWSIYSTDTAILANGDLRADAGMAADIAAIQKGRAFAWARLAIAAAVVAALIGGLFALKDPLVAAIARRLPPELEQRVGDVAYAQVIATQRLLDDREIVAPLDSVAQRLAATSGDDRYDYRLAVADDEAINAFALPGGRLVLTSGLVLKASSPDEIAGVMAHEIAHVERQHSVRQLISSLGLYTILQTFFGDATGIGAVLIDGGAHLMTMTFSREFEREADEVGLRSLVAAEIDPSGMLSFFRILRDEERRAGGSIPGSLALLSTHPTTDERIATLEKKTGKMQKGAVRPLDLDLNALKAAVRRAQQRKG